MGKKQTQRVLHSVAYDSFHGAILLRGLVVKKPRESYIPWVPDSTQYKPEHAIVPGTMDHLRRVEVLIHTPDRSSILQ